MLNQPEHYLLYVLILYLCTIKFLITQEHHYEKKFIIIYHILTCFNKLGTKSGVLHT